MKVGPEEMQWTIDLLSALEEKDYAAAARMGAVATAGQVVCLATVALSAVVVIAEEEGVPTAEVLPDLMSAAPS